MLAVFGVNAAAYLLHLLWAAALEVCSTIDAAALMSKPRVQNVEFMQQACWLLQTLSSAASRTR